MGSQRVGHDWATKHIIKAIRNIPDQNRWQMFTNGVSSLPLPRYNTKVILEYIWGYSFHIILHHNTLFPNIPITLGITIPSDGNTCSYVYRCKNSNKYVYKYESRQRSQDSDGVLNGIILLYTFS